MKVIIIEEDRFKDFLDLKDLMVQRLLESSTPEILNIPEDAWKEAVREASKSFQYHFVKWAQSHGASCVK